jgi:hypothetical protein
MEESREEIRARLLRDSNVIENIQLRAYEIWILRGRVDGRQQEDWALAENEVLNFLVEQELKKALETPATPAVEVAAVEETTAETAEAGPVKKARKAAAPKTATAKTTTRKKAATAEATEPADKKAAAKKPAAKRTTTKKAASKKSAKTEQPVVK